MPVSLQEKLADTKAMVIDKARLVIKAEQHTWMLFAFDKEGSLNILGMQDAVQQGANKPAAVRAALEFVGAVGYVSVMEGWMATPSAMAAVGARTPYHAAPDDRRSVLIVAVVEKHRLPEVQIATIDDNRNLGEFKPLTVGNIFHVINDWA